MTATAPPHSSSGNLPADLTSFVGRRPERTEIRQLLANTRLVTLTGFGGVGKTRLALRVGADVRRAFHHGVWFAELAELTNPALLADTIAKVFGLHTQTTGSALQSLTEHLATRNVLIVLDNCEHLIDACAELADILLRACPDVHILATSREPLGIVGETVLPVAPLPVPPTQVTGSGAVTEYEAITLFRDRAVAVTPGFRIGDDNRDDVAGICRRLEGIPLALELAAVRLRGLSTAQLLEQLDDRLQLLNAGSRVAPSRQRTLRGCIEWSYDLCTAREQRLWAGIAVFSGGFELDAAHAVCGGTGHHGAELLDTVLSLVDKSILISEDVGGRMRYRMLEVIRQYGEERLRSLDDEYVIRLRHSEFYAGLSEQAAEEWLSPRQGAWMDRLRREHANFQRALTFSLAQPQATTAGLRIAGVLHEHWIALGAIAEARHWCERLLMGEPVTSELYAGVVSTAAWMAIMQGDLACADTLITTGSTMAGLDDVARTWFDNLAGLLAMYDGSDLDESIAVNERALVIVRGTDDVRREITTLILLQLAHCYAGHHTEALRHHEMCLRLCADIGDSWYASYSLWNAGIVHWFDGDSRAARTALRRSLRLKRDVRDEFGVAIALEAMAWVTPEPRRAATLLGIAATRWGTIGMQVRKIPATAHWHNACEDRLRTQLGADGLSQALAESAKFDATAGLDYALDDGAKPTDTVPPQTAPPLTRREQEVATLVSRGLSNREIAGNLVIAQRTAETHVEHILTKLGFTSRVQIAAWIAEQPR
ncbi:ATP-binding protein [Nocardia jinanensis]|uniref:LuxR family transcriptional regulator n=1 Tax=Nocardia jinanensis TaxID=382504 RepID=A0A917VSB1_9NOCA|nr:LuxR C-terminal-related transcriptional regulator [Nocardia jinanensis]GGL12829.1 LuxR family transcriptional regulator [Nocardia jinanensis]